MRLFLSLAVSAVLVTRLAMGLAPQETPTPSAEKPTVEQALSSALDALRTAEAADAGEVTPAMLEEISRRLTTLQAADATLPQLSYLYARAKTLAGRRGDAIEDLKRFVETREGRNEWDAHRRLGDLFIDEFPRLAKASYARAAALKSDEPSILLGLSTCAYKVGQLDDALKLAQQAADADSRQTVRTVAHLARMFIAKQQWSEADRAATQAMELAEADAKARPGVRGPLTTLDSQYQLAIDLIQARINQKIAGADDFVRFASLVRRRGDLAQKLNLHECLRVVELGVKGSTDPAPRLMQEYAVLLAEVGRTNDAVEAFEKLLTLDATNVTAKQWLERLRSAAAP